jgi:hypothetical protein
MVLQVRHMLTRNSLAMFADVRLRPGGHGTQVEITLRSQYFAAVFMTFWLGMVSLFTVVGLVAVLTGTAELQGALSVFPFLLFGFGFIAFGRLLTRPDRATLLDFIAQVTGAQRYPDAQLPPM